MPRHLDGNHSFSLTLGSAWVQLVFRFLFCTILCCAVLFPFSFVFCFCFIGYTTMIKLRSRGTGLHTTQELCSCVLASLSGRYGAH